MLKLYIDIDGVLTDTIKQVVAMYNKQFFKNVSTDEINTYSFSELELLSSDLLNEYFKDKNFYSKDILFDENIPKYLERLSTLYEIVFVTIGSPKNLANKRKWLEKLLDFKFDFIGLDDEQVTDKSSVDMSDGIFIDDVETNLETSNAIYKIVYGQIFSWNENSLEYRCRNWRELYRSLVVKAIYMYDDNPEVRLTLNTLNKLKEFCNTINEYNCKAVACQGVYVVDAGSMLGMLSLDIMQPITIRLIDLTDDNKRSLESALFDLKEITNGYDQGFKG